MANRGNKSYHGEEASNISLAGAGTLILSEISAVGPATYTRASFGPHIGPHWQGPEYCVAIKCVSETSVAVQASSVIGDNLTKNPFGVYLHGDTANYILLTYGDIIHGKFDQVSIEEPASGSTNVQLIKGGS